MTIRQLGRGLAGAVVITVAAAGLWLAVSVGVRFATPGPAVAPSASSGLLAAAATPSDEPSTGIAEDPTPEPSVEESAPPSLDPSVLAPTPPPDPTEAPTPRPTPRPTARPTARPTPHPTSIPNPSVSGSFGHTLEIDGVTAYMKLVSDTPGDFSWCGAGERAAEGFTNVIVFDLKIVWPKPSQAIAPGVTVGQHHYGAWGAVPEGPTRSGQAYVMTTCWNPADSLVASLYVDLDGTGIQYAFHFH